MGGDHLQQEWINRLLRHFAAPAEPAARRTIIRFHRLSDYRQCVRQLTFTEAHSASSAAIRYCPELLMISSPLVNAELLEADASKVTIAPDAQIHLSARSYLPTSTKPSLTYDPRQHIPWGVAATRAPSVWKYSKGQHIRIGVVDTGVDFEHPNIRHALRKGVNLLQRMAPATDDNGHGTHIAGTIAAASSTRVNGVAPGALLYPVKAFDSEGSAYISDILLAIHWCIANRMHIINMSFGMSEHNTALLQAVKTAGRRGVIIVASSGNGGQTNQIDYPARFPQTIAVGAYNRRGAIAGFSNRGKDVDIYAPGESIYSTWPGNRYNELSGTSMATAHVSGALALLIAARPLLSKLGLRAALLAAAAPFTSKGRHCAGKLDASRAYRLLRVPAKRCGQRPVTRKAAATARRQKTATPSVKRKSVSPSGKPIRSRKKS